MKKRVISLGCLSLFLLATTSCGKSAATDLTVTMAPQDGMLLDMQLESCEARKIRVETSGTTGAAAPPPTYVTGPKVLFHKLKLKWSKSYILHIISVSIKVSGNGFDASCTLSPAEVNALFLSGDVAADNGNLFDEDGFKEASPGTITSNPSCKIFCPAQLRDLNNLSLSGSGRITVKAVAEIKKANSDEVTYQRVTGVGQLRVMP